MKIVTMIQTKGGSGKTTLAMTLATAALSRQEKVVMFDGDVNKQLMTWQSSFEEYEWGNVKRPNWSTDLQILEPHAKLEELYSATSELEKSGVDLVIIDTRPGTYEDTEDLALISDLVLIPAKPAQAEWRQVVAAFDWMEQLRDSLAEGEKFPEVRSVIVNVPTQIIRVAGGLAKPSSIPERDRNVLNKILETQHLDTMLPTSRIFEHFLFHGPLSIAEKAHRETKGGVLMANNLEDLTAYAVSVYDDALEVIGK